MLSGLGFHQGEMSGTTMQNPVERKLQNEMVTAIVFELWRG